MKKTKAFAGEPAPFVMELPAYHAPVGGNVLLAGGGFGIWTIVAFLALAMLIYLLVRKNKYEN